MATFERHWLTGTGLNTYQVANLFYQQHDLANSVSSAHNDYLQLAAEGGLLLIVPILLCVAFFVRDVRRRFREDGQSSSYWLRAGAVAGLVAIAPAGDRRLQPADAGQRGALRGRLRDCASPVAAPRQHLARLPE